MLKRSFFYKIALTFLSVLFFHNCNAKSERNYRNNITIIQSKDIKEIYDLSYYSGKDHDSIKHKLNLFLPEGVKNPPIMLWIHGGAWAYGGRKYETELARKMAKEGIAVAVMSYRLSPATWRDPEWDSGIQHPEHIKDVARAFSWIYDNASQYKYDKHSVFVSGYSAGAHLAALLAMDPTYLNAVGRSVRDIRGVIPIAGAYDIEKYYNSHLKHNGKEMADSHVKASLGNTIEALKQASPTSYVKNQWVAMLVISETQTYDYTLILENAAKNAKYDAMQFYHIEDKNHDTLYKELLKDQNSANRKLIVDYIKNNRADYEYLDREDCKLAYKIFGKGEPLFLLNGGPGFSSHNFQSLAKKLIDKYQVIIFDQRGTGFSEVANVNLETIQMESMVEDLEALRKHLGLKEVSLLGHSFGGIYAMSYAAVYPENIKKMILSHSGGMNLDFLKDVDTRLTSRLNDSDQGLLGNIVNIDNPDLRTMKQFEAMAAGYLYNYEFKEVVYKGLAFNSRFHPKINTLIWRDLRGNDYDLSDAMKTFNKPVLIIQGESDIVNPEVGKYSHSIFPNSKLVFLENCVHYGWLDSPKIYFKEVLDF